MSASKYRILLHQYLAVISGNIINVSFGATFAWFISNAVDFSTEKTPLIVPPLETSEVAWIGTTQYIGAVVGTVFFSLMGDAFGRKNTLAVLVIPQMASFSLIMFSTNATELYIARFVSGFVGGGAVILMILFTAEITEYNQNGRGKLLAILPLSMAFGFLIEQISHAFLTYRETTYLMVVLCFAFSMSFTRFWDTPRQLCSMAHKQTQAERSMKYYRLAPEHNENPLADFYYFEIKKIRHCLRAQEITRRDFATLSALKATTISLVLLVLQCLCISFITNQSVLSMLYRETSQIASPIWVNIILAAAGLIGMILCTALVDSLGRKPLILGSTICSALGLIALGFQHSMNQSLESSNSISFMESIITLSIHSFIWIFLYSGIIPLVYVLIPEIFPEKIRSINVTIALSLAWFIDIFLVHFGDSAFAAIENTNISYCLSGVCLFSAIFFMFVLPETKKKNYDEILILMDR